MEDKVTEMLDDCSQAASCQNCPFSEWELTFLDSILQQFEEKKWLSDKQKAIVERMWEKI